MLWALLTSTSTWATLPWGWCVVAPYGFVLLGMFFAVVFYSGKAFIIILDGAAVAILWLDSSWLKEAWRSPWCRGRLQPWLFVVSFGVVVLSFSGLHGIVFILGCRHLVLYVY
ncbi:unnamed protein product [Prorocentrum cordatum]|uniref:Uncharacterized protein n=1 Tax=Prorocentrum cordatum TaxID=2364126 RepID=A0ABN9XKK1_9DINO|nr:unnamed protein product [Polarella glacialis]